MQHSIRTRTFPRPLTRQGVLACSAVAAVLVGILVLISEGVAVTAGGVLLLLGAVALGVVAACWWERARAADRLRGLVDGIGPIVMLVDARGVIEYANRSASTLIGDAQRQLVGRQFEQIDWIRSSDRGQITAMLGRASIGETVRGDASFRTRTGQRIDLELWMRPIASGPGRHSIAISAVDVTERREGADTRVALMQELDHRMKNTLHMVQAMIRRTARSHGDVASFERALVGRIQAFSRSHEILARERWMGASLRTVVGEAISVTFDDDGGHDRVELSGPRLWIEPRATLTLGLVIHELAANAWSHGALGDPEGRVDVLWAIEEGEEPTLVIDWRESQTRQAPQGSGQGFGRMYIERGVRHELDGEVHTTFGTAGLQCLIRIPLARVTERAVHGQLVLPGGEGEAAA